MAIEVVVDTKDSTKQIEAFAGALGELAQNADRLNSNLEFKNSIAQEFKAMRSVMSEFSEAIRSSIDEFKALGAGTLSAAAAMKSATAVADQVTQAIQNQTVSLKEHVTTLRSVGAEQERLNKSQLSAKAYLESQKTTQQKVREELQRFHKIAAENNITGREYARILEMITQKHKGAGLEIERTTQNLRNQVGAWGKTNVELLKMTSGWDLMSKRTQQNIIYLQKSADAQKVFSGYLKDSRTELQKHTDALDLLNKMRSNGFLKGNQNEQLYLDLKKSITAAIENERKAQEGLNNARKRTEVQAASDTEYSNAIKHLETLRAAAAVVPKVAQETEKYRKTLNALTGDQKKEFELLSKVVPEMGKLERLYTKAQSPLEKYKKTVEAAANAHKLFQVSAGKMGIAADTARKIQAAAFSQMVKNTYQTGLASKGLMRLVGGFGLVTQTAAGARAAMIGAGQSFGIFEGRTLAVAGAVYALARAIKSTLTAGSEFQYLMDRVAVLSSGNAIDSWTGQDPAGKMEELRKSSKALSDEIRRLGAETQFTANEVAEAADILARTGQSQVEILANLAPVLDLAAIAMVDMATAADIATGVLAAFRGQIELTGAVDILAATSVRTKATITDLGKSIEFIGPLAAQVGLSFAETAAALGVLADVNIKATKAGTGLRRMLVNLQAPNATVLAGFKGIGVTAEQMSKTLGEDGLVGVFDLLAKQGAKIEDLRKIFGMYAISPAAALLMARKELQSLGEELDNVGGSAEKVRNLMRQNLSMAFEELTSAINEVQIAAFTLFGPELTEKIKGVTGFIDQYQDSISEFLSNTVGNLISAVQIIVKHIDLIWDLVRAYLALKVSITITAAATAAMTAFWQASKGAWVAATLAIAQGDKLGFALNSLKGAGKGLLAVFGGIPGVVAAALAGTIWYLTDTSFKLKEHEVAFSGAANALEGFSQRLDKMPTGRLQDLTDKLRHDVYRQFPLQLKLINDRLEETRRILAEGANQNWLEKTLSAINNSTVAKLEAFISPLAALRNAVIGKYDERSQAALERARQEEIELEGRLMAAEAERGRQKDVLSKAETAINLQRIRNLKQEVEEFERLGLSIQANFVKIQLFKAETQQFGDTVRTALSNFDFEGWDATQLKAELAITKGLIEQITNNTVLASAAMKLAGKDAEAWLERLQAREALLETVLANIKDTTVSPEITKAASELTKYFDAYEKAKGPVYAVARDLGQVEHWMQQIATRSPTAMQALKEAGISIEEAGEALAWMKEDLSFQFLENALGRVDKRFSNLRDTLKEVEDQELSVEEAIRKLWETLNDPAWAEYVKQMGGAATLFNRMLPAVIRTADGSAKLESEWKQLKKTAAEFEVVLAGNVESLDDMIKKYAEVEGVSEAEARRTVSLVRAKELLGDSLKKTADETETLALAQELLTNVSGESEEGALRAAKAYNLLWSSMPVGKLEAQNLQLKAQIALVGAGAREQAIYNAAVSEFGANWMYADDALKRAAGSAYDLNYELERIEKIKSSYVEFGEGVIGVFADMFAGIQTSFSDMGKSIKDMFQKLLRDLIYLSLRNKIMISLGMEGPGSGAGTSGIWGWARNLMSFMGGGRNAASVGTTGTWSVLSSGASIAATPGGGYYGANNFGLDLLTSGGGAGAGAGAGAGNISFLSNIFSSSTWINAGKNIWTGLKSGMSPGVISGSGMASNLFGTYYGSNFVGPLPAGMQHGFNPGMGTYMAGVAGALYGYNRSGNVFGAAGYGALGLGAAGGLGSLMAGGSFLGGAGSAFASLGGASFIPVLGWIAAAAAIVDMVSGGKLFGTKYKPESSTSTLALSTAGAEASLELREVKQRSLFRGRSWRDTEKETTPEMDSAAQKFYNNVYSAMADAATRLAVDTPPMIDAALRTVTEYDSKGKEKATRYFVDVIGRTWEEATAELGASRITAEAIISVIDSAFGVVADHRPPVGPGGPGGPGDPGRPTPPGGPPEQVHALTVALDTLASMQGQATLIAERWRDDAEKLLEGASFLVLAAADLRQGLGLLGEDGTLLEITDLIESLSTANETLSETYARVYQSTKLLEQSFALAGVTSDLTRVEFVKFATEVTTAMGGIDAATQKWNAFYEAFYSAGELAKFQRDQLETQAGTAFGSIGLSLSDYLGETGMADFRSKFEELLPTLTPTEIAAWVEAGLALAAFTDNIRKIDAILANNAANLAVDNLTTYQAAVKQLTDDFNAQRTELEDLGATTEQLTTLSGQYDQALAKLNQEFRKQIDALLSDNDRALKLDGMSETERAIFEINERFQEMKDKLSDLGGTTEDLDRLEGQRLLTLQRLNDSLKAQISDLLSGVDRDFEMSSLTEAERVTREINQKFDDLKDKLNSLGATTGDLTRLENQRTRALEEARKELELQAKAILAGLKGEQSSSTFERAMADVNKQFDDAREALLELGTLAEMSSEINELEEERAAALTRVRMELNAQIADLLNNLEREFLESQMTTAQRAIHDVNSKFDDLRATLEDLGADVVYLDMLERQRTRALEEAQRALKKEISNILEGLTEEFTVRSELGQAIFNVNAKFDDLWETLLDLGATADDLIQLEKLRTQALNEAAESIARQLDALLASKDPAMAFAKLTQELREAERQARGLGASEQQLTRLRRLQALEVARFISDIRKSISTSFGNLSEYLGLTVEEVLDNSVEAAQELYDLEKRRYEMAQKAIEDIGKYLMDLEAGPLSPGDWKAQLGASRSNFEEMLALAQAGDEDALRDITKYADALLRLGKDTLGDTMAYADLYQYVTNSLRGLATNLGTIAEPVAPMDHPDAPKDSEMSPQDAFWAILELAEQVGKLSAATNQSVFTILQEFGIPLLSLAEGMGVNLDYLNRSGLDSLNLLATSFNTTMPELLDALRVNPEQVASILGVNLDDLRAGILGGLAEFAEYMGTTIPEALTYLGVAIEDLAPAFGIYIEELSEGTLENLKAMADALGILPVQLTELLGIPLAEIAKTFGYEIGQSSAENFKALRNLADALGLTLFNLGEAIGEDFSTIVEGLSQSIIPVFEDLPEGVGPEVRDNLKTLLDNIADAANPHEVQLAVTALLNYTQAQLPGSFAEALQGVIKPLLPAPGFEDGVLNGIFGINSAIGSLQTTLSSSAGRIITAIMGLGSIGGSEVESTTTTEVKDSPTSVDYLMEVIEARNAEDGEDLYEALEASQNKVAELTLQLTEATEKLIRLQNEANETLTRISSNTTKINKPPREVRKL